MGAPWDVGGRLAQAFALGRRLKMQQDQMAQEKELRDVTIQSHKLEMDRLKHEQRLSDLGLAQKAEAGNIQAQQGMPAEEVPSIPGSPAPAGTNPLLSASASVPPVPGGYIQPQPGTIHGATIPGLGDNPPTVIPNQVIPIHPLQQLLAMKRAEQAMAPVKAEPGTIVFPLGIGNPDISVTGGQLPAQEKTQREIDADKVLLSNPQGALARVDQIVPPTGPNRALNSRAKSLVLSGLQTGNAQAVRDAYTKANEEVRQLEVATDPRVLAAKQQIIMAQQANPRLDKSFEFNNKQLDEYNKPVSDLLGRMSRLNDTLAQGTPQADAMVAPELLSVMSGGQGSGLRMNEAEIARMVGGRSNWESLKAAINKWKGDPNAARSITPAQQEQIQSLVGAVNGKLQSKSKILSDARQKLLLSNDIQEHRQITSDALKSLNDIDSPAQEQTGKLPAKVYILGGKRFVQQPDGTFLGQ